MRYSIMHGSLYHNHEQGHWQGNALPCLDRMLFALMSTAVYVALAWYRPGSYGVCIMYALDKLPLCPLPAGYCTP